MSLPIVSIQLVFQSTPSVGRATIGHGKSAKGGYISIHALRGEGDQGCR